MTNLTKNQENVYLLCCLSAFKQSYLSILIDIAYWDTTKEEVLGLALKVVLGGSFEDLTAGEIYLLQMSYENMSYDYLSLR
jgi:hypothetical protein